MYGSGGSSSSSLSGKGGPWNIKECVGRQSEKCVIEVWLSNNLVKMENTEEPQLTLDIEKWANTFVAEVAMLYNNIDPIRSDELDKNVDALVDQSINCMRSTPCSILHLLSSIKRIITVACSMEDEFKYTDRIMFAGIFINLVSPKGLFQTGDPNIKERFQSIISAIPNCEIYQQNDFFTTISGDSFLQFQIWKHESLYNIVQHSRHYLCILNEDWSFNDLTYMEIIDKYGEVNEDDADSCIRLKRRNFSDVTETFYNFAEIYISDPDTSSNTELQQGLPEEGDHLTADVFLFQCVQNENNEENFPKIIKVLNSFVEKFFELRKNGSNLEENAIIYTLKFIAVFNLLLISSKKCLNKSNIFNSLLGFADKLLEILKEIRISEVAAIDDLTAASHIVKGMIRSTSHLHYGIRQEDIPEVLEKIGKRALAIYTIICQNIQDNSMVIKEEVLKSVPFTYSKYLVPDIIISPDREFKWMNKFGSCTTLAEFLSSYEDDQCGICLSSWKSSSDVSLFLNCTHIFCLECIKSWFKKRSNRLG